MSGARTSTQISRSTICCTRKREYVFFRALGSVSCDITHETGGTICYAHWVLRLVISHTRQGVRFVGALDSASCDITHETGGTICYGHWNRGYDLLQALGSVSCDITQETGDTICYGHWVLCLVLSYTRQGVHWALRLVITHETGGTICDGHWVLRLVISHKRQEVRFVTSIAVL